MTEKNMYNKTPNDKTLEKMCVLSYDTGRLSAEEGIIYESISRQILNSEYYNSGGSNNCPGYVNVSSYTRDGREVSGYTRNCPYHGN